MHIFKKESFNLGSDKIAVMAILKSDMFNPPMAQMKIRPQKGTDPLEYTCNTFESRPYVILNKKDLIKNKIWKFSFIDPFGNEIKKEFDIGDL